MNSPWASDHLYPSNHLSYCKCVTTQQQCFNRETRFAPRQIEQTGWFFLHKVWSMAGIKRLMQNGFWKNLENQEFWVKKVSHCTPSLLFMINCLNFHCRLSRIAIFPFWKMFTHCRDIVVQSYPTYVHFHVHTWIANKAWELAEILTAYSSDTGL